ncbi:hypothetical protein [Cognatilysobacter lacus]|uniref:hypothetical protein n=1 Tax=Cognatilysobacter lacus TaxID=1643323 RepID=UPI0011EF1F06|nr:hypothetical protein [Lysobacter lacus]
MSKLAAAVDHALSRVLLGLLGVLVTASIGVFALGFVSVNPLREPAAFLVGLGGCLGLLGWWLRVAFRSSSLARRPRLRGATGASLLLGLATVLYQLARLPLSAGALPFLAVVGAAAIFMFLGTLGIAGSGPNNSSKPTPLRGAA